VKEGGKEEMKFKVGIYITEYCPPSALTFLGGIRCPQLETRAEDAEIVIGVIAVHCSDMGSS
jgi:hypothetical protein